MLILMPRRREADGIKWVLPQNSNGLGGGLFSIYDVTAAAVRLVIDSSGNVGIGTAAPVAPLNINPASTVPGDSLVIIGPGPNSTSNSHTVDINPSPTNAQNSVSLNRATNAQNNTLQFEAYGVNSSTNCKLGNGANCQLR